MNSEKNLEELKKLIKKERKIIKEIINFHQLSREIEDIEEKRIVNSQIKSLKDSLNNSVSNSLEKLDKINLTRPLIEKKIESPEIILKEKTKYPEQIGKTYLPSEKIKPSKLEKNTLKRLKIKEKEIVSRKIKKPNLYVRAATKTFAEHSKTFIKKGWFRPLERNLIKSNLQFLPINYVSLIIFTSVLSIFVAMFISIFFFFFSISATFPRIGMATGDLLTRFIRVAWLLVVMPIGTFLIMYNYPSLEQKATENKINEELPFATIHMAAISGSMVDPSKIFSIVISTKDYIFLEKEFTKIINEINIYGIDLINALRRVAFNNPSEKLSELLNGMVTTLNSGGDLTNFFEKRSQSLLFDHKLEREKYTKFAETFMDIYISVVIAAPMILMLLLMMIKISGLGIDISVGAITLIMILGVSMINIAFLTFLHLKQPSE